MDDGQGITMMLDTGAAVSLVSEVTYKRFVAKAGANKKYSNFYYVIGRSTEGDREMGTKSILE